MEKKTFRQAVLVKPYQLEVQEVPMPKPGPGMALVKMKSSSICNQTDLNSIRGIHPPHDHQFQGMIPHDVRSWLKKADDPLADAYPEHIYDKHNPFPSLMGHEGMGVIVELGPQVEQLIGDEMPESEKLHVGDRVGVFGLMGGIGEYVVAAQQFLLRVPDHVKDEHAGLFEPVSVSYLSTRAAKVDVEDSVCILGGGALGLMGVQFAKLRGAGTIIVSEPVAWKREMAIKYGATHVIDPTTTHVVKEVERITKGVFCDAVFEYAGLPETIRLLPYLVRENGVIIQVGAGAQPALVDWDYIHFKHLRVDSVLYGSGDPMKPFRKVMKIIASGRLDLDSWITHRFSLDEVNKAFDVIEKGDEILKCVFYFDD